MCLQSILVNWQKDIIGSDWKTSARLLRIIGLLLPIILLLGRPASADDISDCTSGDANQRIQSCSKILGFEGLDDRTLSHVYNNRGVGFGKKQLFDLAISDFSAAIRLSPQNYHAYRNRGNAYYEKGSMHKALSDYTKAIELKPNFDYAYFRRALIYYRMGQFESALADLNRSILLNDSHAYAYNNRGLVHEAMNLKSKAIADYQKALELDPTLDETRQNLSRLAPTARLNKKELAGLTLQANPHSVPEPQPVIMTIYVSTPIR